MQSFTGGLFVLGMLALSLSAQVDPDLELRAAKKAVAAASKLQGAERTSALSETRATLAALSERDGVSTAVGCKAALELGRVSAKLKDWKNAEVAYRRASASPEPAVMADALTELAAIALRHEKRDEAEQWLVQIVERCAEEEQERARAMVRLGEIARTRSKVDEAGQWFRRVLAEHGDLWRVCADALEELVELQLASGDRAAAKQTFDAHATALRARFAGSPHEKRLATALGRITARAKLDAATGH
jgi:lipopolysaccharide biosynthesis regulator YciM